MRRLDGTKWHARVSCPVESSAIQTEECEFNHEGETGLTSMSMQVVNDTFYKNINKINREYIICIADYYQREDIKDELLELFDKSVEYDVAVWLGELWFTTNSSNSQRVSGTYTPHPLGDSVMVELIQNMGGHNGLIILHKSTILGSISDRPLDKFLEVFRHEMVHAAQDFEEGIDNFNLGLVSNSLERVWNQRGVADTEANYFDKPQWVQDLEVEANSAETDIELVRLAFRLAEDGLPGLETWPPS